MMVIGWQMGRTRIAAGDISGAKAARDIAASLYAQTGYDGHLSAAAGKAQLAELNKEIKEAELSQAGVQLVCEAHKGLEVAKVADAAAAAQDALSQLEASNQQLESARQMQEHSRAMTAAGDAALASAKGKLNAFEFVGARASLQVARQFYKKAGDDVWAGKKALTEDLDADVSAEEERQQKAAEQKVNASAGDAALRVAREKLAAEDVAGANAASAAAASFFDAAGVFGDEKAQELEALDQQILELAAKKQAVVAEQVRQRAEADDARQAAVQKAEAEVERWKMRAEEERRKSQLVLGNRMVGGNLVSLDTPAAAEEKGEAMEAVEEEVSAEVRQAQRAMKLLEEAKKEAADALAAITRAYEFQEQTRLVCVCVRECERVSERERERVGMCIQVRFYTESNQHAQYAPGHSGTLSCMCAHTSSGARASRCRSRSCGGGAAIKTGRGAQEG